MIRTQASVGELVRLAVDADGGDGFAVLFVVTTADGTELTRIDAPIEGGAARASWAVDVGDRPLPVEVRFTAHLADQHLPSGGLTVVRTVALGPVELTAIAADPAVARGALGPVTAGHPPAQDLPGGPAALDAAPRDSYALTLVVGEPDGRPCSVPCDVDVLLERAAPGADFALARTLALAIREVPGHRYTATLRLPDDASDARIRYRVRVRLAATQATAGVVVDPGERTSGAV